MMMAFFKKYAAGFAGLLAVVAIAGCKEKFTSPVPPITTGYLVVEGVVNYGGETNIHLSRTVSLDNAGTIVPELGASVQLEDSLNNTTPLYESSGGTYTNSALFLDAGRNYRLTITTSNNEIYQSDFVKVRINPPIDSISWVRDKNGVQLFINTHDPSNNTRYYQWDFDETWEFHSPFIAGLKWTITPGPNATEIWGVAFRDFSDPQISICWQSDISNSINLGSSAKLAQDVIHLPLIQIPDRSLKLNVLYSVMVRQYAWSKEGYDFLGRMKKNTEAVGSVFDAQPSELNGNLHCVSNPNLPVIGFFNICTIQQKRIFIKNSELPDWNYRSDCMQIVISNISDTIKRQAVGGLPIDPVKQSPRGDIITFHAANAECVDCRLSGTNVKPDFWP